MDHGVLNSDIQITDVETDDDELVLSDEEEQEIEPVADYLLRMLKTGWCSDFQINLHSRRDGRPCLVFSLHSTLAWRNLHLRNMIKLFDREKLPKIMNIAAGEYFLCPRAFDQAIQTLYGGGLVSGAQLTSPGLLVGQWEPADPTAKMDFALSYLSAGAFLRDRAIMHRAIHLISQVLNWNTVESLVRFGLYSSKFTIVCTDGVAQNISEIDSSESDSIVAGGYYPRYARYWTPQQNDASASDLTLNRDLVHFWAPRFLQSALQYVAVDFPADFKFDPTARSTIMPDRLKWPVVDGVRVAESNPAKESNETKSRVASALFVSLPFKCLRKLFKFMTKAGTMDPSTAREVVAARESRRKSTLQELDLVETEDRHLSLASEVPLGWEESVKCEEEGTRKVISMKRKWVGNDSSPPVRDGLVH